MVWVNPEKQQSRHYNSTAAMTSTNTNCKNINVKWDKETCASITTKPQMTDNSKLVTEGLFVVPTSDTTVTRKISPHKLWRKGKSSNVHRPIVNKSKLSGNTYFPSKSGEMKSVRKNYTLHDRSKYKFVSMKDTSKKNSVNGE